MAIRGGDIARSISGRGKRLMTEEEFKTWLMAFDTDKDGRISRKELRHAIRSSNGWFNSWKSGRGMAEADADGDGYIELKEIDNLMDFAESHMGFRFYCC